MAYPWVIQKVKDLISGLATKVSKSGDTMTNTLIFKSQSIDITNTPTSTANYFAPIKLVDKNNLLLFLLQHAQWTSGENAFRLIIGTHTGAQSTKPISIGYTADGRTTFGFDSGLIVALSGTAAAHNSIYRGRNLTNEYTLDELSAKIQANNFHDLYIGDYIEVPMTSTYGTETVRWLFAGFDTFLYNGDTSFTKHHIVLVPEDCFKTLHQMNSENVTTGGYANSAMNTTILPAYVTALEAAFGSHLASFRTLMSTSVNTSLASMAGAGWTGASNGWAWNDSKCRLLGEIEVYGSTVFSSSLYDIGEKNNQLPLFRLGQDKKVCGQGFNSGGRCGWWLSAVASSTSFAIVNGVGDALHYSASDSCGVRPLILFV